LEKRRVVVNMDWDWEGHGRTGGFYRGWDRRRRSRGTLLVKAGRPPIGRKALDGPAQTEGSTARKRKKRGEN
jgi:hypothetical protein